MRAPITTIQSRLTSFFTHKKATPLFWKVLLSIQILSFPSPLVRALTLHDVELTLSYSATLSKTLIRSYLFYPLASLDVSGQWPVFNAGASPNEELFTSLLEYYLEYLLSIDQVILILC